MGEEGGGVGVGVGGSAFLFALAGFDDGHDVVFAHHQQFFAVYFDGGAGVFAEEDAVAGFDVQRADAAVVFDFAVAGGDDFALVGLFGGAVGG